MGLRGMPEGEIAFEDLEVPATMAVLPPSGFRRGFADLMNAYNSQRVGAGTVAMGIAAGALDHRARLGKEHANSSGARSASSRDCSGCSPTCRRSSPQSRLMLYQAARSRGPDSSAFPDPMLAAQAKIFAV